jgi:hypothetical protein
MEYPALPEVFTPQIIQVLTLRQFIVLAEKYGLHQLCVRLGFEDFISYWEQNSPGTTLAEFLRSGKAAR